MKARTESLSSTMGIVAYGMPLTRSPPPRGCTLCEGSNGAGRGATTGTRRRDRRGRRRRFSLADKEPRPGPARALQSPRAACPQHLCDVVPRSERVDVCGAQSGRGRAAHAVSSMHRIGAGWPAEGQRDKPEGGSGGAWMGRTDARDTRAAVVGGGGGDLSPPRWNDSMRNCSLRTLELDEQCSYAIMSSSGSGSAWSSCSTHSPPRQHKSCMLPVRRWSEPPNAPTT
mmetsp:Transcript_42134/g.123290  ORF Transcript_42134/g.123290 Transcript_42134/m.123290 type:complete len:228 (+) Transcript_42134:1783-2466(+)